MSDRLNVTVAGGKYTYIQREDYSSTALRYGGTWPAFDMAPPDNLHNALAVEVQALRDANAELVAALRAAQRALALIVEPNAIKQSTVIHAFAQTMAAEAKSRAALAKHGDAA